MGRAESTALLARAAQRVFSVFNPSGSAGVFVLLGCVAGCAGAAPTGSRATEVSLQMPRLFYTPQQRSAVVRARLLAGGTAPSPEATEGKVELPPPMTTFVLQGVTQAGRESSAWINGQPLKNGEVLGGRTIHIGPQVVHLRQKGEADVILRPGQGSFDPHQPVLDAVPAGAFSKNTPN
jgi:hypothetical protein